MKKPTASSDDNRLSILPETALRVLAAPRGSPIPPPTAPKKRTFDSHLKYNPHTLLFEAGASDGGDSGDSGDNDRHTVKGSGGGHIDEDSYRMLGRDQQVQGVVESEREAQEA